MEILWWTYLATLYGTILWIAIQFVIEKDKFDEGGEGFDLKLYTKKNWDNWTLAFLGIPFVVYWGPDATKYFFEIEWSSMGYGLSGFITQALYFLAKKYLASKK